MSDWQAGDLAVCVDASPSRLNHVDRPLVSGQVYAVRGTRISRKGNVGLFLVGIGPGLSPLSNGGERGWAAERFRKIRPDEHQACEEEFVTLLKRAKRPVSA